MGDNVSRTSFPPSYLLIYLIVINSCISKIIFYFGEYLSGIVNSVGLQISSQRIQRKLGELLSLLSWSD